MKSLFSSSDVRYGYGGKFWEDFEKGQVMKHRLGRTISFSDNLFFALTALNTASLHFDTEYAGRTEWGKPIAIASMIISIVCGLSSEDVTMNLVKEIDFENIKMVSPLFEGDTLHAESEVIDVLESKDRNDAGVIVVKTSGFKDEWNTLVCEFTRSMLVYKRNFSPRLKLPGQTIIPERD